MIVPSIIYNALCNVISALQYSFQLGIEFPTNSPSLWPLPSQEKKTMQTWLSFKLLSFTIYQRISKLVQWPAWSSSCNHCILQEIPVVKHKYTNCMNSDFFTNGLSSFQLFIYNSSFITAHIYWYLVWI